MKSMTVRGLWWLPATPDDKQSGTFLLDGEQSVLTLDRSFAPLPPPAANAGVVAYDSLFKSVLEPVVYGVSADGQPYSLLDCVTHRPRITGEVRNAHNPVHAVLSGVHLPSGSREFDGAVVTYSHLLDWAGWPGMQVGGRTEGTETLCMVHAGVKRHATYQLAGAVIHLDEHRRREQDVRVFSVQQEARFTVELAKAMDWLDLCRGYVLPLNDFLSFATLAASAFGEVLVHVPGDPDGFMWPLSFSTLDMRRVDVPRDLNAVDMLFTLADTTDMANLVGSWFELNDRYRLVVQQLLAGQYAPFEWADNAFLAATRAADAFYGRRLTEKPYTQDHIDSIVAVINEHVTDAGLREFATRVIKGGNHRPQQGKIEKLLEHSGKAGKDVLAAQPAFAQTITRIRNGLAHPNSEGNPGVIRRHHLEQALRWVLRACLLKELGFDDHKISQLLERNSTYPQAIGELSNIDS